MKTMNLIQTVKTYKNNKEVYMLPDEALSYAMSQLAEGKTAYIGSAMFSNTYWSEVNPNEVREKIVHSIAFSNKFWTEKYEQYISDSRIVVVDGEFWLDGGYCKDKRGFLGCGGAIFHYVKDGITHMTNNMWHAGRIPDEFRTLMPDNARFIDA